jgi:Fe-S oxidoreductase
VRVALLATCLVDGLFPDVGKATVGLLERLGHRVEVPPDQTCCGQMHINTGYVREALPLVRRHVAVFEATRRWCPRGPFRAVAAAAGRGGGRRRSAAPDRRRPRRAGDPT